MKIRDDEEEQQLNLAPMIDVVFLLLIFFMVATTFIEREKEMGLELPVAESGDDVGLEPDEIVINLMRDGTIRMSGEDVGQDELAERLSRVARRDPETPVTIRGDRAVEHGHVVGVMDACRGAGLVNLGVMTLDG